MQVFHREIHILFKLLFFSCAYWHGTTSLLTGFLAQMAQLIYLQLKLNYESGVKVLWFPIHRGKQKEKAHSECMVTLCFYSAARQFFFSLLSKIHKLSQMFAMSIQLICPPEISSGLCIAISYRGLHFPVLPHHRNMVGSQTGSTLRFYFSPLASLFSQSYTLFLT